MAVIGLCRGGHAGGMWSCGVHSHLGLCESMKASISASGTWQARSQVCAFLEVPAIRYTRVATSNTPSHRRLGSLGFTSMECSR